MQLDGNLNARAGMTPGIRALRLVSKNTGDPSFVVVWFMYRCCVVHLRIDQCVDFSSTQQFAVRHKSYTRKCTFAPADRESRRSCA